MKVIKAIAPVTDDTIIVV